MFTKSEIAAFSGILVALAGVITAGRLYIRIHQLRRIEWTDSWNLIALVFLVALVAIENQYFPYAAETWNWYSGQYAQPPDHDVIAGYKLQLAEGWMLQSTLTSVKISLLLFYRCIFGSSRTFQRLCWVVLGAVGINYFVSTLSLFWSCGSPSELFVIESCVTDHAHNVRRTIYILSCTLTLCTSLAIIILPTYMLRGLEISFGQKLGLASIFALAAGDITLEIPRTVYAINGASLTLLLIWNILQGCVAVVVCGLPTYRGIFAMSAQDQLDDNSEDDYGPHLSRAGRRRDSIDNYSYESSVTYGQKSAPATPSTSKPSAMSCTGGHPYPYPFKCVIEGGHGPPMLPWAPPGDETGVELDGGDIFGGISKVEKRRRPYCVHCPPEWNYSPNSADEEKGDLGFNFGFDSSKQTHPKPKSSKTNNYSNTYDYPRSSTTNKKPSQPEKAYIAGNWADWAESQRPSHMRWASSSSIPKQSARKYQQQQQRQLGHKRSDSGFGGSGGSSSNGGGIMDQTFERHPAVSGGFNRNSGERVRLQADSAGMRPF